MIRDFRRLAVCVWTGLLAAAAAAQNIDLSTVPPREGVQLTIYNSCDLTLVRETRTLTFRKGLNPLQFSWANTLIDPTSVELRFRSNADRLTLSDTVYPHDRPQVLYWNIESELDGAAVVEISYFTSGISWAADYLCVADGDESTAKIECFVRVTNQSGEQYDDAQVRLVVGNINMVEQVAELARVPAAEADVMLRSRRRNLESAVLRVTTERYDKAKNEVMLGMPAESLGGGGGRGAEFKQKLVVKEGLSEYFIFTIEGTETIPDGWSKRLRSFSAESVPMEVVHRYRPAEYGDQLVRLYLMRNDKTSRLGDAPLPDGQMRVFRDNGRGGLEYVAALGLRYVPVGDRIELNLGHDPHVQFELVPLKSWRDGIWLQVHGGQVLRRADQPGLRIDERSEVVGWDQHTYFAQRIRNFSRRPLNLEIRRTFGGDASFLSRLTTRTHDFQTVEITARAEPGERVELPFELVVREGRNAKQNRLEITTLP